MDLFKLIVELIVGLAWPAAIVWIITLFRGPIRHIAARAIKGQIGPVSWEIPPLPPTSTPQLPPPNPHNPPAELLASPMSGSVEKNTIVQYAPLGAILVAWKKIEQTALRAFSIVGPVREYYEEKRLLYTSEALNVLHELGVLDEDTHAVTRELNRLRNGFAHSSAEDADITVATAQDFVEVAEEISRRIIAGTDRLRLDVLLKELQTSTTSDIEVGPLSATGMSEDKEISTEDARSKARQWKARTKTASMVVSTEDASILLRHGARYQAGIM